MPAKFVIYKDAKNQFRFRLKAANGEIIAAGSESYPDKNSAKKGIASIQKNAPTAEIIDETVEVEAKKPAKEKKPAAKKPRAAAGSAAKKPRTAGSAVKRTATKKAADKPAQ